MNAQDPRVDILRTASNEDRHWDVIVIGGGASGLSAAWDAISRGLKVALLEQYDFAKSTSSKSTKLVHGGVRYLQKMDLGLVFEALRERQTLLENAPEFCRQLDFILPCKSRLEKWYYRLGLCLYDLMGRLSRGRSTFHFPRSRMLGKEEVLEHLPHLKSKSLSGGICYSDAQFDDAGMAVALAQVINGAGKNGVALSYVKVTKIEHLENGSKRVLVSDSESEKCWQMTAKVIVNATGVYTDQFRDAQGIEKKWQVQMSRGAHIVCKGDVLSGRKALIVPKTSDGRVLFAIPWQEHTIIGTTDVATDEAVSEPLPSSEELEFLLNESKKALGVAPTDVLSQWAGLRPLVSKASKSTKSLSRKHVVEVSQDGIISLLGGKWTTARAMGEDAIDVALKHHKIEAPESQSASRKLIDFGALTPISMLPLGTCAVHEAVMHYYARTVEDVLSRRKRTLLLDAAAAKQEAESVSKVMAELLGWSEQRRMDQVNSFIQLADRYIY